MLNVRVECPVCNRWVTKFNSTGTLQRHKFWLGNPGFWCPGGGIQERKKSIMGLKENQAMADQYPILQYFKYSHLSEDLQKVSAPFCTLAWKLARSLPRNAETSVALRKLLEAKDAAVRAATQTSLNTNDAKAFETIAEKDRN